jgi:GT2 family glycosyltransferase
MMIRKAVFSEVGLLDENIFMYGEDVEFCLRARSHHWDVAIDTQAVVTHLGSASSSSVRAIEGELKGYLYIWSKHGPLWQLPLVKLILKAGCVLRWLVFGTMAKQPEKAQAYARIWQQL